MILQRKPGKKRARYEQDDDFDASDNKNNGDFARSRCRYVFTNLSENSISF
jgi:hypothetical protein